MMEAVQTSETLVNYQFTWRYNPEDSHLHLFTFNLRTSSFIVLCSFPVEEIKTWTEQYTGCVILKLLL
jgi:hypothetical protein